MKTKLGKGLIFGALVVVVGLTLTLTSVNASSVYSDLESQNEFAVSEDLEYSVEEMLAFAIQDEYLAIAEYEAIILEFGEVRPFINIVQAEQTHIDLLLPLFVTYGIEVPENNAAESVIVPDSITSAIATGLEAEEKNIAMYQLFLSQDNLGEDVRSAFEYLLSASENHLAAFSNDRLQYYGQDMMEQVKNRFRKMFQNGENTSSNRGNGQGNKNNGECLNNQQ
ncbi:MAG: hypothetical protein PF513_00475 [Tenericutes bacterium]|jgi:hypothetical protein|nr:hypothetical protein [Mycoplasmatota bacterium]